MDQHKKIRPGSPARRGNAPATDKATGYRRLEDVVGCKWSVSVLMAIDQGVNRPGQLERHIPGISTKVLGERLRKLHAYGLLHKQTYPEVPPRTEYLLTDSGRQLTDIIRQLHRLDADLSPNVPGLSSGMLQADEHDT